MVVDMTQNQKALKRCQRCEWSYQAEDSEFPSRFIFDLAYQICDQEVVLNNIEPQCVIATDIRGRQLFTHDFSPSERNEVSNWFRDRLRSVGDSMIQAMAQAIELDQQSRIAGMAETFRELKTEREPFITRTRHRSPECLGSSGNE